MYTGRVHPGGPADVRELPQVVVSKLSVGPMDNNAYLLRCRATGAQVLIDAAAEPQRLLALIGPGGLDSVITTHRHGDHWQALAEVVAATSARTIAHPADASEIPVATDDPVIDGASVAFGSCVLSVIHIDGHTPGSIALLYEDPDGPPHLFTGDSLFPGGVGSTQGDAERFAVLLGEVEDRIFARLPDETWVYPGHGADTTLGAERPSLGQWRERGW